MKRRTAWLVIGLFTLLLVTPSKAFLAEPAVTVGTVDSAGIEKLIKESGGTIIVGMASWCFPCRQELPTLVKLYNKYKDQGLKVVGISVDISGPSAIQPIVNEEHVNFPVYWGGEPAIKTLEINRLPMLLLVKNGAIVERVIGKEDETVLDGKIQDLLKP